MRWLIAVVGAVLGAAVGEEGGFFFGALVGFAIGWAVEREQQRMKQLRQRSAKGAATPVLTLDAQLEALSARVEQLERTVAALRATTPVAVEAEAPAVAHGAPPMREPVAIAEAARPDERGYVPPAVESAPALSQVAERELAEVARSDSSAAQPWQPSPEPPPPRAPDWTDRLRAFVFGGNTVVRAGVLVLTVGVGLLVKYAADQSYLPLELRLGAAAAIGLALVLVGYRTRRARPGFGTALQGGGVAAMYLVTFFAHYAYHLLPATLTMALLIAIAAFSTVLAVAQDAVQLAVFGAIGGFLAPLLASTGSGNHVALFSYYALLNATIAAAAWYRAWRLLNWVGFVFTFGVASAWGALKYEPANMASSAGFLALFFAFYLLTGTLFALRRPGAQRGAIDTTLTFGTPLATLGLAGGLFRLEHLYLALWCAGMAAVYLAVAASLLARKDEQLRALAQAYVAVGMSVATLAIPFALGDELATALAWTAEASGLIWVGVRQQRLRTRIGGYVLFLAALFAVAVKTGAPPRATHALFLALIATGVLFASYRIERAREALHEFEHWVGDLLLGAGLLLWLGAWSALVRAIGLGPEAASLAYGVSLLAHAVDMLAFEWVGARIGFAGLRLYPRFGFVLLALQLAFTDDPSWQPMLLWPVAIVASYWPLWRQDAALSSRARTATVLHALGLWVVAGWLVTLVNEAFVHVEVADGWQVALRIGAPLLPVALAIRARPRWPFAVHARAYRAWAALPILLLTELAACVAQLGTNGDPAPLPYLPLLNPFDLAQLFWIAAMVALARTPELARLRNPAYASAAVGLFIALNGTIVRTAHFWAGVPFESFEVPDAPVVQAAFSILWTVLALIAMLLANRRKLRAVWIAGALLLAVVVGKLFLLDLDGLSGGAKIITFLAVGVLLLLIGYFAPVPPKNEETR